MSLYIALSIFVTSKEIKVDEKILLKETTVLLTENQMKIASFILNDQPNPKFHNYFFLISDAFSARNKTALITASNYNNSFHNSKNTKSLERQIIDLATKRFIMKNIDYKICYNYLFSKLYFGQGKYGLAESADFYYKKSYKNLTDEEFKNLCMLLENPVSYSF